MTRPGWSPEVRTNEAAAAVNSDRGTHRRIVGHDFYRHFSGLCRLFEFRGDVRILEAISRERQYGHQVGSLQCTRLGTQHSAACRLQPHSTNYPATCRN